MTDIFWLLLGQQDNLDSLSCWWIEEAGFQECNSYIVTNPESQQVPLRKLKYHSGV